MAVVSGSDLGKSCCHPGAPAHWNPRHSGPPGSASEGVGDRTVILHARKVLGPHSGNSGFRLFPSSVDFQNQPYNSARWPVPTKLLLVMWRTVLWIQGRLPMGAWFLGLIVIPLSPGNMETAGPCSLKLWVNTLQAVGRRLC